MTNLKDELEIWKKEVEIIDEIARMVDTAMSGYYIAATLDNMLTLEEKLDMTPFPPSSCTMNIYGGLIKLGKELKYETVIKPDTLINGKSLDSIWKERDLLLKKIRDEEEYRQYKKELY